MSLARSLKLFTLVKLNSDVFYAVQRGSRSLEQLVGLRPVVTSSLGAVVCGGLGLRHGAHWPVRLEDSQGTHWAVDGLLVIFFAEIGRRTQLHVDFEFLIEPHPDALLVELVFTRRRDDFLCPLSEGLLADTAVSLVRKFKLRLFENVGFHQSSQRRFLFFAPLRSRGLVQAAPPRATASAWAASLVPQSENATLFALTDETSVDEVQSEQ